MDLDTLWHKRTVPTYNHLRALHKTPWIQQFQESSMAWLCSFDANSVLYPNWMQNKATPISNSSLALQFNMFNSEVWSIVLQAGTYQTTPTALITTLTYNNQGLTKCKDTFHNHFCSKNMRLLQNMSTGGQKNPIKLNVTSSEPLWWILFHRPANHVIFSHSDPELSLSCHVARQT